MLARFAFSGPTDYQAPVSFVLYEGTDFDAADERITLEVNGSPYCTLRPGDSVELDAVANGIRVLPPLGSNLAGTLVLGTSRINSTERGRQSVERASGESGWRRTLDGVEFITSLVHTAAAGVFPCVFVRMTGTSRIALRQVRAQCSAASRIAAYYVSAASVPHLAKADTFQKLVDQFASSDALDLLSVDATTASPLSLPFAATVGPRVSHTLNGASGQVAIINATAAPMVLYTPNQMLAIVAEAAASTLAVQVEHETLREPKV